MSTRGSTETTVTRPGLAATRLREEVELSIPKHLILLQGAVDPVAVDAPSV